MTITEILEHIACLILLYIHGQLSLQQHDELDAWVEASDENVELFATATDDDHIRYITKRSFMAYESY